MVQTLWTIQLHYVIHAGILETLDLYIPNFVATELYGIFGSLAYSLKNKVCQYCPPFPLVAVLLRAQREGQCLPDRHQVACPHQTDRLQLSPSLLVLLDLLFRLLLCILNLREYLLCSFYVVPASKVVCCYCVCP